MRAIRVLVVDDAPEVRQGLSGLLPLAGAAAGLALEIVGEAGDGGEAIERALALRPDVILMDLEMPEIDGYAATKAVKGKCPSTRVVALTVHGGPVARQRAWEAGVDGFVEKGVPMPRLVQAIGGTQSDDSEGGKR